MPPRKAHGRTTPGLPRHGPNLDRPPSGSPSVWIDLPKDTPATPQTQTPGQDGHHGPESTRSPGYCKGFGRTPAHSSPERTHEKGSCANFGNDSALGPQDCKECPTITLFYYIKIVSRIICETIHPPPYGPRRKTQTGLASPTSPGQDPPGPTMRCPALARRRVWPWRGTKKGAGRRVRPHRA